MGDAFSIDRVFVGNLGRYNEGDLVGAWLELPYDEEELDRWLRDSVAVDEAHEEVFIMDSDLGGPLGEIGVEVGEWGDLSLICIASRLAADLTSDERESVRQWAETAGSAISPHCAISCSRRTPSRTPVSMGNVSTTPPRRSASRIPFSVGSTPSTSFPMRSLNAISITPPSDGA